MLPSCSWPDGPPGSIAQRWVFLLLVIDLKMRLAATVVVAMSRANSYLRGRARHEGEADEAVARNAAAPVGGGAEGDAEFFGQANGMYATDAGSY